MKRFSVPHAPPISLKDVLGPHLSVAQLGEIVRSLPGAVEHGPKANETWRYLLRDCWVLGYKYSAVVAGDYPALIPLVAAQVRAAVDGHLVLPPVLDTPAVQVRASSLETVSCDSLLPPLDTPGAHWEPACDWTAQPWADAWIAQCHTQPPPARMMDERISDPVDPFTWAVREGYR